MASCNNHQNHDDHLSTKQAEIVVVVVPFPAQGHLNQHLQLACTLATRGFSVHYVGSATHNRQAKLRANEFNTGIITSIHFHDLEIPEFRSLPPTPNVAVKFPAHLQPAFDASLQLRQPVAELLRGLSSSTRRIVVIHDLLMAAVVKDAALIPNTECYALDCLPLSHFCLVELARKGRPFPVDKELLVEGTVTDEFMDFIHQQIEHEEHRAGMLFCTSKLIEGTYFDLLAREEIRENLNFWAVGPLLPVKSSFTCSSTGHQKKCLEWLDKQPPDSVIYISFGSSTSMTNEEIRELAIGLEESGQRFIWVLREADRGDIFTGEDRRIGLPEGFEERLQDSGIVVREWAPQVEILAHPSTGGFMSHCGWNSCIESITMGVPIAAWPMHSDQPWNAWLITETLNIGLSVREWAQHKQLAASSTIADAVKRLMASEEGSEIRKRARELSSAVRQSTEEGGASRLELESFVAHITR